MACRVRDECAHARAYVQVVTALHSKATKKSFHALGDLFTPLETHQLLVHFSSLDESEDMTSLVQPRKRAAPVSATELRQPLPLQQQLPECPLEWVHPLDRDRDELSSGSAGDTEVWWWGGRWRVERD